MTTTTNEDETGAAHRTTVRIPTASGDEIEAWLYQPEGDGPHPAVVLAHGFAAVKAGGLAPFAEAFRREGFAAIPFDYRHWGGSSGEPRDVTSVPRSARTTASSSTGRSPIRTSTKRGCSSGARRSRAFMRSSSPPPTIDCVA